MKELLKQINAGLAAIAKSLVDGKTDEAVDELQKQADLVSEAIKKSDEEPDAPAADPQDVPAADPVTKSEEEVLTKSQQETLVKFTEILKEEKALEALQKWVELYISAGDVPDFVQQFDELKTRISAMEKESKQLGEEPEAVTKGSGLAKSMGEAMK